MAVYRCQRPRRASTDTRRVTDGALRVARQRPQPWQTPSPPRVSGSQPNKAQLSQPVSASRTDASLQKSPNFPTWAVRDTHGGQKREPGRPCPPTGVCRFGFAAGAAQSGRRCHVTPHGCAGSCMAPDLSRGGRCCPRGCTQSGPPFPRASLRPVPSILAPVFHVPLPSIKQPRISDATSSYIRAPNAPPVHASVIETNPQQHSTAPFPPTPPARRFP